MALGNRQDMAEAVIAVLDVGKTNIKLSAVTPSGKILESSSISNAVLRGPPWAHHDIAVTSDWIFSKLAEFCRRHPIGHVVTTGHGVGGLLVGADPDATGGGVALPMIDYEQSIPDEINRAYAPVSGTFFDRGSAILGGATHLARQALWMEMTHPTKFAGARWLLGLPQYWAWRLSGVAVSECSYLAAQSHLWNVIEKRWSPIVRSRGWSRLMPPFASAWQVLGPIRPAMAARYGLPDDVLVHAGAHDSTANFYRYQAAGLSDFVVASTGTWIVGLADRIRPDVLDERKGMTLNCDVEGRPLGGALVMGGREFALVAGEQDGRGARDLSSELATLTQLVNQGTMALPAFADNDGQFPGVAGKGRIAGQLPQSTDERRVLATLYCALLTVECINTLGGDSPLVIDGAFLLDPLFAHLVAALRPERKTLYNSEKDGVASGAALLCSHEGRTSPVSVELETVSGPAGLSVPLTFYAKRWRALVAENTERDPILEA